MREGWTKDERRKTRERDDRDEPRSICTGVERESRNRAATVFACTVQ